MAILFADVLAKGRRENMKFGDIETRDWFRDLAMRTKGVKAESILQRAAGKMHSGRPIIGQMFLFQYDPKHKKTLPYYDIFPLIFPIEILTDGFIGLNMHYLPPLYRARLMDALYTTLNNKSYSERSKLNLSYDILKSATKFKYFKPTIHRYLTSHVKSELVPIDIKEWDYTLFLPIAQFMKASQQKVWNDSKLLT